MLQCTCIESVACCTMLLRSTLGHYHAYWMSMWRCSMVGIIWSYILACYRHFVSYVLHPSLLFSLLSISPSFYLSLHRARGHHARLKTRPTLKTRHHSSVFLQLERLDSSYGRWTRTFILITSLSPASWLLPITTLQRGKKNVWKSVIQSFCCYM